MYHHTQHEYFFRKIPNNTPSMVVYTCNAATQELRQEDPEFEACLGYTVTSSLAWAIEQGPISKKKNFNKPHNYNFKLKGSLFAYLFSKDSENFVKTLKNCLSRREEIKCTHVMLGFSS
jgi:hypothetical protein